MAEETKFLIGGEIVRDTAEQFAFEDVTPAQVRAVLGKLEAGAGMTFEISSPGGDVTAGLAIANLIKGAQGAGHPCKAHVIGVAASMASVITCACDEVEIDEGAFMMIHNPWTVAQGDADELRKSADVLDQMRDSILGFYRSKFDKTDDEIKAMMDGETWFTGRECKDYGFKAAVIANAEPLKAAACARSLPIFARTPENAAGLFVLGKHEEAKMDETNAPAAEVVEENVAQDAQETPAEASAVEPTNEPTEAVEAVVGAPDASGEASASEDAPQAETVTLAECEKRVSGMQSTMAKKLEAERTARAESERKALESYAALEREFKTQLAAKDEELMTARAEVTRLAEAVKKTESELQETASALKVKTDALATLNAAVNAPAPVLSYAAKMEAAKTPEEREALRRQKARGEIQ